MPQELQNLKRRLTKNVDWAGGRYASYKFSRRQHLTDPLEWKELLAEFAQVSHEEFYSIPSDKIDFAIFPTERGETISFTSPYPAGIPKNDQAVVELFRNDRKRRRPTILFVHGRGRHLYYRRFLSKLFRAGFDIAFYTLPYHMSRTPRGYFSGELMFTGNLPRSFYACRQAVTDVRVFINWLSQREVPIHLMGISLGALIIGNILTIDPRPKSANFIIPVTDPEEILCSSPLSEVIRQDIKASKIDFDQGRFLFKFITPHLYPPQIDRSKIFLAEAESDQYVSPKEINKLWQAWGRPLKMTYPHSHSTLIFSPKLLDDLLQVLGKEF